MEVESRVYGVEGMGSRSDWGAGQNRLVLAPEQVLNKSLSNDWVSKWHSPVGCCYFVYSSGELMGKNLSRCYDHSVEDRGEAG